MSERFKHKYFYKGNDGLWVLKYNIEVNVGPTTSSKLKAGFRTNFASIPTWPDMLMTMPVLGWLFRLTDPRRMIDPDDDEMAIPSAFHDGWVGENSEYVTIIQRSLVPGVPPIEIIPNWARAANDFKKLTFGFRAPPWKRFVVYWSVRIYGMYRDRF